MERGLFRVVTLNVLHDPVTPTWPQRAPLLLAQLCTLAPDIVPLQEVAWPDEQATALAAALGEETGRGYTTHLTGLFAPNGWQEGLALLSRFPVHDSDAFGLPGSEQFCQRARLDVGGRALDVYNVHLDPYSIERVGEQVGAVLAWMGTHIGAGGALLGGDFNATPDSAPIARAEGRLRSAHALRHGHEVARTSPTPFGVERLRQAGRRAAPITVDYLFLSPALSPADVRLVFDRPADDDPLLYPSDHYGLLADLHWTG
ncbi:MAG: hypothetical protein AVDCRST_MAG88-2251 [uncultured Thermomicrobiales bacterium]|uniref:Endonuclease/exonuclease/phosphatase domain-containing protein n=1 Tax=uncultured Thermomicrobiales bacterium TaxID=1645740 RepID=A0A6J4V6K4_9BACT|nr:MAG: hypothetical protein AVDCRST_MAG88-2251 [uncultured Thermomicrobiales bacterium]